MSIRHAPFDGPYFDPTGLGFAPPSSSGMNWRARSIVTICCDPLEREAVFLNADGYALPLEPHPYELRRLLEQAESQEFGKLEGIGQFAQKPAMVNALQSSGRLKRWILYRLPEPAGYANDAAVWAGYVAGDLEEERKSTEASHAAAIDLYTRRARRAGVDLPWPTETAQKPELELSLRENLAKREADLADQYRARQTEERAIAAWLRGDAGGPPLLALMQVA
jgi:hypothetical protein